MPLVTDATYTRKSFITRSGKKSKKAVFHTQEAIDTAINQMNLSMARGVARSQVITNMRSKMKVHRSTIENWLRKQHLNDKKVTKHTQIVTKPTKNGSQTSITTNKLGIHSVTFNGTNGYVKLTLDDIDNVGKVNDLLKTL